ncbi:hypothetical protein BC835DRAFT_117748 [Cytidiella melzeri]|nr:hypothetical protein BC835DRAFT_117748 [Cytidiella melzeri]
MTITIRIQYKGDAARKLATDESSPSSSDPPKYVEQMERALSHFSIPPPQESRAVWKSGFVLCNWNTSRDSRLFDIIFRGATRAQSIACKGTLESLSISFIHLFENSKPIWLNYKGRNNSTNSLTAQSSTDTLVDNSSSFERKTFAPHHRNGRRSPAPDPSFSGDSILSRTSTASSVPFFSSERSSRSQYRRLSAQDAVNTPTSAERSFIVEELTQPASAGSAPHTEDTLRRLSESQTLLALLSKASVKPEATPSVKEEILSPTPSHLPISSRVSQASHTGARSHNDSISPAQWNFDLGRSFQKEDGYQETSNSATLNMLPTDEPVYSRTRRYELEDSRVPPADVPTRFPMRRRSASPGSRTLSAGEFDDTNRRPQIDRGMHTHRLSLGERRYHERNDSKRQFSNQDDRPAINGSPWPSKRPLSPASGQDYFPSTKRHHPVSSIAAEAAASRRLAVYKKPYNPVDVARRTASPVPSRAWGSKLRGRTPPDAATSEPPANVFSKQEQEALETPAASRPVQVNTLNRELWDVRRQITALKAREDTIAKELAVLEAPQLPDPDEKPALPSLEERVRSMEHQLQSLRERLQREKERRQLVEESCENERRRRKLAEDILDDTRRETSAPNVLPAMMDAFEKIAQLTGDALNKDQEQASCHNAAHATQRAG